MTGPVALTGATGFIGRAVLNALTQAGIPVRALTRQPRPDTGDIHWITGDLHDAGALRRLVTGADAIVHCAGRVRGASRQAFHRTNVEGTRHLAEAAAGEDGPGRFLLVSSLAAREPQLSWYAASKREAEQVLADHAGHLNWAAFRPTAVYGPGDREISPLLRLTRYGILPLPGGPDTRFGLLHVDDLVAAILAWLASDPSPAGIYEIDDGTGGYDRDSLARIAAGVWGRPVRALSLPAVLVRLVGSTNLQLARMFRYSPMLTPGKVRELLHPDWVCDNTPLIQALQDWRPRVRLQDALRTSI